MFFFMCLWETHGSDDSDRSDGSDKSDESDEVLMMMVFPVFFYLLAFTVAESMIFPWRSRRVRNICLLSTVIDMAPTI